jgi:hypothetical protein
VKKAWRSPHLILTHLLLLLLLPAILFLSPACSWVENNGAVVECEEGVEVSPLVSYAGEGLDTVAGEGVVFAEPYDLTLQGATGQGKPKHNAGPWAAPVLVAYAVGAGLAVAKQLAGSK